MFDTCNQTRFEAWFSDLSACVWGNDFEPIKAGGQHGDKKSDGRRVSTETVFQCYAPDSPATFASKAVAKVQDSFPEVLTYWSNLSEWVFVHNNAEGITSSVSDALEKLREAYPNIKISSASRRFLKDELHDHLTLSQMLDVYPDARRDFSEVGMEHVRPLLKRIISEKTTIYDPNDFGDIPSEAKLDHNSLSEDAKFFLNFARQNIGIVDRFIGGMNNPENASIIQSELREKYLELRDFGYQSDEVLGKLVSFVRVEEEPKTTAAAYVILAYYFDACDIFENVPEDATC
ncbi:hypothetical protein CYMTET_5878 [Cymbomonas tetramitiformis]|uniref:ABC-three component systems C-terminal domain-containing protein n=1 Tax=Cymbomonas tetramitiformis TaxID=36881 RepID=A0AAE0GYD6_9CHLO|nr:hypothetical protein CYMTET_5815 [Cymbomonas tetramitiformis]KAK3286652.1 hypothetical protein CYMTET_5878 [Cymbomonas tetramitiformis]